MTFAQISRNLPLLLWLMGCLLSCQFASVEPAPAQNPYLGGATTVFKEDHNAFSLPAANMPMLQRLDFSVGNSFFRNPWVIAPATTTARDGLGPLFNTNACQNCHIKDGRGHPPEAEHINRVSMLVRISLEVEDSATNAQLTDALLTRHGAIPVPNYGLQIQDFAVAPAKPEAEVTVSYEEHAVTLNGRETVMLRSPTLALRNPAYGPLPANVRLSARIAPAMIGLGLLEAISADEILHQADPEDHNRDGISGRPNWVWDEVLQQTVLGRFGWKAGQPTLRQQNAAAFAGDLGITSLLFPAPPCADGQTLCANMVNGGEPELSERIQQQVDFYSQNLAVPAQRRSTDAEVIRGQKLFHSAGCGACHRNQWTTGRSAFPWLSSQKIAPYTDLLLHDMGPGLADHRSEFSATGQEWRTPPLWGIGLMETVVGKAFFLHDGRARSILEAILWHGGEADASRHKVVTMAPTERRALLNFLHSL